MILSCDFVKATEIPKDYPDVTDDIEIRYKWYKEIVSENGEYVPLKNVTKEDKIDENKVKYVGQNIYDASYCNLPTEYYLITEKISRSYKITYTASYVLIENITPTTEIKIYSNRRLINYKIISSDDNKIKINLVDGYTADSLLFYVDSNEQYKISIYHDSAFKRLIVSKELENTKISFPDKTWITDSSEFYTYKSYEPLEESDLTTLLSTTKVCSYKEKYVYKYQTTREYYDDNYYLHIDNYIKDEQDYRYYYKGEPITITNTITNTVTNTVEVVKEKIVPEPKIEYVYIEKEINQTETNDSSQENKCLDEIKIENQTKIVEKEIMKTPKTIYIIIIILSVIIFILGIKLYKKYVE